MIKSNVFENITSVKCTDYDIVSIGKTIKEKFDEQIESSDLNLDNIDIILIENQISTIANRMAIIQGMIAEYFLMKNKYNIKFISSANKLKLFIGPKKTTYNERKKLSIEITNNQLNKFTNEWKDKFLKNKKRDDLADCFLQGLWYFKQQNILYYAEDLKIKIV